MISWEMINTIIAGIGLCILFRQELRESLTEKKPRG